MKLADFRDWLGELRRITALISRGDHTALVDMIDEKLASVEPEDVPAGATIVPGKLPGTDLPALDISRLGPIYLVDGMRSFVLSFSVCNDAYEVKQVAGPGTPKPPAAFRADGVNWKA